MPPTKRKLHSSTPLIAGADNPTLNSNVPFGNNAEYMDYTTGSPDTLQHLDATNVIKHTDTPHFTNAPQLDFTEGGYNEELSDDSAGSSKRSARRNDSVSNQLSPHDTSMTNGDMGLQGEEDDFSHLVDYSNCADADSTDAGKHEKQQPQHQHQSGGVSIGVFGPMASGFGGFSHRQSEDTPGVNPHHTFKSYAPNRQSPSLPTYAGDDETISPSHNRQHSIQSTESGSSNQWHGAVDRVSPMAMSQTHSPASMATTVPPPPGQSMDQSSQSQPFGNQQPQIPSQEAMSMMAHGRMTGQANQGFGGSPDLSNKYNLELPDPPSKSRVETQTQLSIILRPPPPNITKLHLPPETVSKPKLMDKPKNQPNSSTLEMSASVVCVSAMQDETLRSQAIERASQKQPGELPPENTANEATQQGHEVRICSGCMTRERKRAARKRIKNPTDEEAWLKNETHRIIVFNTNETKQWERIKENEGLPGLKLTLPMRVACYCRHHGEKSGFNIIFTLKDHLGNIVAQNMTNPIMITDDHKTGVSALQNLPNPPAPGFLSPLAPASPGAQQTGNGPSPKGSSARRAPRAIKPGSKAASRATSPSQAGPSAAKKRKPSKGTPPRIPQALSMTKVDPPYQTEEQSRASSMELVASPNGVTEAMVGHSGPSPQAQRQTSPFIGGYAPRTQDSPSTQFYSNPPSGDPSRASSPQLPQNQGVVPAFSPMTPPRGPVDDMGQQTGNQGFRQARPMYQNMGQPQMGMHSFFQPGMDGFMQSPPNEVARSTLDMVPAVDDGRPRLIKVIPHEGSMSGGYEVTVLGKNFAHGVNIWFGEQKAHYTNFWSTDTVICLVPGLSCAQTVSVAADSPVTPENFQQWPEGTLTSFTYTDDTDDRLMKLALRLIGSKMTGNDVDVNIVARQVLQSQMQGGNQSLGNGSNMYNQAASGATGEQLEMQLLGCLDFIDNDDSPHEANFDIRDSSGQTLLHLAAVQGFRRLVAGLLSRGARVNALDRSRCTALHMAAMYNRPEVVQKLIAAGANPKIQNLSDEKAVDLSESGEVTRAIRHSLVRSQSADFSHSRASSASSLRSLFEPMPPSKVNTWQDIDDGEESLEYTTGDFEDEDPDENVYLHMRRPSAPVQASARQLPALNVPAQDDSHDGVAQPAKTITDLKEHFQAQLNQLQQSWAMHVQNHFPQMPQMPQMPALPAGFHDYQAYLQQAPFMRRMTSYMPSMNGSRPESQDGQAPKMDHRWWDLSQFMTQSPVPPPAYEEIYPQGDVDRKQASAAAAAADAEADEKCATLYDYQTAEAEPEELQPGSPEEGECSDKEPRIITIGRKNAITKEQQEQLLRARDRKHTRLRNDRNLFFVWIPLLILMICAMAYSSFPSLPSVILNIVVAAITIVRSFVAKVRNSDPVTALGEDARNERVVEL